MSETEIALRRASVSAQLNLCFVCRKVGSMGNSSVPATFHAIFGSLSNANRKARLLVQTELLVEAADTAAGVHHLLLTGVEGMALGANLNTDVLLGRTSLDHVTASAADGGQLIVRMDSCLHYVHLFLLGGSFRKRNCYAIILARKMQLFFRIFSKNFSVLFRGEYKKAAPSGGLRDA